MDQTLSDYLSAAGKAASGASGVLSALTGKNNSPAPAPGTPAAAAAAGASSKPSWFWWAIGGGAALLGLVVVLMVRK